MSGWGRSVALVVTVLAAVAGASYTQWLDQRADHLEAVAKFDGYADPAPLDYPITIPVIRPTKRYGLIDIARIDSSRGGFSVQRYSIAIGREPIKTDAGQPLQVGQSYCFHFKQRWYDTRRTYRMKIYTEP